MQRNKYEKSKLTNNGISVWNIQNEKRDKRLFLFIRIYRRRPGADNGLFIKKKLSSPSTSLSIT